MNSTANITNITSLQTADPDEGYDRLVDWIDNEIDTYDVVQSANRAQWGEIVAAGPVYVAPWNTDVALADIDHHLAGVDLDDLHVPVILRHLGRQWLLAGHVEVVVNDMRDLNSAPVALVEGDQLINQIQEYYGS